MNNWGEGCLDRLDEICGWLVGPDISREMAVRLVHSAVRTAIAKVG